MSQKDRISHITVAPVPSCYRKELGKNSNRDNIGLQRIDWVVRARTGGGAEGLTIANRYMRRNGATVERLLRFLGVSLMGRSARDLLAVEDGAVVGPGSGFGALYRDHGWLSVLAFDLYGKLTDTSAVDLFGGRSRSRAPAYDTTLYFQDFLVPEKGAGQAAEEAAQAVADGWRAVKIKVGRGARWMLPADGMARDVAVVQAIRDAVGPDVKLMVDGNFGYDGNPGLLEDFIRETGPCALFWLEEMITQDVDGYRRLRELQQRHAPDALVTCGEVDSHPIGAVFQDLIDGGLIDGYQPDIVGQGFTGWMEIERRLEGTGVRSIPHNFGNGTFGTYAAAAFGAASKTFVSLEDERCLPNVFTPEMSFSDGAYEPTDRPGLGMEIDPAAWRDHEKHAFKVEV